MVGDRVVRERMVRKRGVVEGRMRLSSLGVLNAAVRGD